MIKRENPECDILLVHMPLRDQLTGKFPLVTGAVCEYEKIAGYYGLPSLFAPGGFRALENSGAIQSTDYQTTLFRDEAHLSPAGLDYFLKMLEDSVTELLSGKGRTASLPVALNRITTEKARPIPVEPWMIAGPFTEEHFHNSRFDVPYLSLPPGSRLKT